MNKNLELLKRIHHDLTNKCNIAIFSDWALVDDYLLFPDERSAYDKFINGANFYEDIQDYMDCGKEDVYFSINNFRHQKKKSEDIWHLNAIALDFDFYKIPKYKGLTPKEMYETYIKEELDLTPSAVVDSGNGLYVIYIFKHASRAMNDTYKAIYKSFLHKFEKYGLDSNAMNLTQVIRIPGTINTKTLNEVEVMELNDTDYEMKDFFPFLPYTKEEVKKYKTSYKAKRKREFQEYTMEQLLKSQAYRENLNLALIEDLKTLIYLRNKQDFTKGYRELLVWIVRKRLHWEGVDKEKEIETIKEINNLFKEPLSQKELIKNTFPAGKTKCLGIEKTIKRLNISAEEQRHMKVLRSKTYKDSRRNKLKRRNALLNLTDKQIQKLKRQASIVQLKRQGMRNADIARKLNLEKSTVTRDWQQIQRDAWRWKQSMKELFKEFKEYIKTDRFLKQTIYSEQEETLSWLKTCEAILE